jgi:spore coat protein U-like protein
MSTLLRLLACSAALVALAAHAATCSVSTIGVNFGSYNVFNTVPTDITGSVSVTCNKSSPFTLSLSTGSGTFAARTMKNGTNILNYNLFSNATHLTIWGDGSSGTSTISATSASATFTVYGRIPARQNVRAGSYSDVITVTVTF